MKRFVSVLLAAMMIFSAFSLSGFAQNSKAEEFFEKITNGVDEITLKLNIYDPETESRISVVFFRKGDAIAFESDLPVGNEVPSFLGKIKLVIKGESVRLFFPLVPFVSIKVPFETVEGVLSDVGDPDLTFVNAEEKDIDGTKCCVETYTAEDGGIVEYTYRDDELLFITATDPDGNLISDIYVEEVSYSAAWYQFLTPFITIDFNDGFIDIDDLKISGIL